MAYFTLPPSGSLARLQMSLAVLASTSVFIVKLSGTWFSGAGSLSSSFLQPPVHSAATIKIKIIFSFLILPLFSFLPLKGNLPLVKAR
ncbi:DUF599 family protein [Fulvivirga kasyanovii]|uniref:DUF599 family protein n=1 Tax=Fulvivirga kasyanovii TaxID=396812 RepID=A0ABW9RMI2_9BACT|nr:DUF599 family protein [Fulvivirga kasyanovii]